MRAKAHQLWHVAQVNHQAQKRTGAGEARVSDTETCKRGLGGRDESAPVGEVPQALLRSARLGREPRHRRSQERRVVDHRIAFVSRISDFTIA